MLIRLMNRAKKTGVDNIIDPHQCSENKIGIENKIDFALAFRMIHETPNPDIFLEQIYDLLKPAGTLFIAEPKHHISQNKFEEVITSAKNIGYQVINKPKVAMSFGLVLKKREK